jgi:hypothetical protein
MAWAEPRNPAAAVRYTALRGCGGSRRPPMRVILISSASSAGRNSRSIASRQRLQLHSGTANPVSGHLGLRAPVFATTRSVEARGVGKTGLRQPAEKRSPPPAMLR